MDPYLARCLNLAALAGHETCPNPRVGAVLLHEGRIIGEGFHRRAGGPHAEVEAVRAVQNPEKLRESTLYVSLEPCNHHGRTPPCTELILNSGIPRVVVGCLDPNPRVAGSGVARLRAAGVDVQLAADQGPFVHAIRDFFVNQQLKRPYISLKWASSCDGFIGRRAPDGAPAPVKLSGLEADVLTHRLRAWHQAIMVGRQTVVSDRPRLDTRLFPGPDPLRIVPDRYGRLPDSHPMLQDERPLLLLSSLPRSLPPQVQVAVFDPWPDWPSLMQQLHHNYGICSILAEGGATLLRQLIQAGCYDEIYRYQTPTALGDGVAEPALPPGFCFTSQWRAGADCIGHFDAGRYVLVG